MRTVNRISTSAAVALAAALLALACGGDAPTPEGPAPTGALTAEQRAVRELTEAIAADPDDPELLRRRGELYYANEVYDLAVADLQSALRSDSTDAAVWHLLADAQLDGLQSREALNTMIYAAARFPERTATLLKLAEFQYILQRYDDALATLDRVVLVDPGEAEAFFMIGQVLSEAGDTARAVNAYVRATELDADLLDAYLSLGVLHEALGNSIAERYFTAATAVDRDNALPYRMRADYYARQDRLADALAGYDDAIAIDPRLAEAFYNSGLVLLDLDSLTRAEGQFERAAAIRPGYADAHFYLGVARELRGDVSGARAGYQQALNLRPDDASARQALARLDAGETLQ